MEEIVVGDKFSFGGEIVREITDIQEAITPDGQKIKIYIFDGILALNPGDPLWKLARSIKGDGLPQVLQTAYFAHGNYVHHPFQWTPKQLLRALYEDIATLRAAGVEGGGE